VTNKKIGILFLLFSISSLYSQYGSVEVSSGGFSFIPAFMDTKPNVILRAGTGTEKRVSAHLIGNIRMSTFNPRSIIFITRMKVIDKKFKLAIGGHLPAFQIDENLDMLTYFAQEVSASYPLNDRVGFSTLYTHGKGRNSDLEINLVTLNTTITKNKFRFLSQVYFLDLDSTFGLAETVTFRLTPKIYINGFANYTLSNQNLISTLGLQFLL
jgi:hypothetical protein